MFPKDSALMILSKGKKGKKKRHHEEESYEDEMDEDYEDEMEDEYSDEQVEMAEELISAIKSGDPAAVLDAVHGIFDSY